ncbi:MAG: glycosyltransferase family 2 protein [Bacteroidales bacterium]|nr:glycosyltransferase family 2 protein [Bacteroidales bacterium]
MQIKISILIPIHNRLQITKPGLESLFSALQYYQSSGSVLYSFKVVVIDDGSTDGSSEFISKNYPNIHLLKGDGNLWWSGAINKGAEFSISELSADYLLLWNNDIEPEDNYFIELGKSITKNPNAILGSYIYDFTSKKIWAEGGWFNVCTGKRTILSGKQKKSRFIFKWLAGMGTLVPVKYIKQFGYWDSKNFPQYHGDFDFTIRMSKKGIKITNSEKLILYNKTEYSSIKGVDFKSYINSLSETGSRYNMRKDIMIYRKHCISPFWVFSFIKKHLIYFIRTFLIQKKK